MPNLLSIQNLSIQFTNNGEKHFAVKNISIDIKKKEIVAIVGESGSGKSLTALSLLQLLPSKSSVTGKTVFYRKEVQPVNLIDLPAGEINAIRGSQIGIIFQEPMTSLNPVITCGNQVIEIIKLHKKISTKKAKQIAIQLFEKVKLPNPDIILKKFPHELSGGQKQRVMIAIAISCNPTLLIADEPTTALDVTVQKTILELIKELQEENNMSVILITHDLGIVADVANKIVVMYKGEIVEQGTAKQILLSAEHPYTKALLACRPAGKNKGDRLPIVSDFIKTGSKEEKTESLKQGNALPLIKDENRPIVLKVENLKVYFPTKKKLFDKETDFFKAIDDVSFEVIKGETLGLVGESGCGKTTLGRTILQLIKPTGGKIILEAKDITTNNAAALRNIRKNLQIVFQDPYGSLNPRITIGNAILEPLHVHNIFENIQQRKEKVIELLEKVSLSADYFNRYPHQFSGGQRQRICIARALALNPSFLIFDESVSALDVSVQAQVLNLLNDLKKEYGFTSIFISHDLSVVKYISDNILVMYRGKIVERGTASQIYHSPQNVYTQKLIDAIPGKNLYLQ